MKVKTLFVAGLIVALMAGLIGPAGLAAAPPEKADFLIGFHVAPGPAEQALVRGFGGEIFWEFTIVNAVAAHMSPRAADALSRSPRVAYVEPDGRMYALEQTVPWGIDRVFGDETYPFNTWSASTGQGIGVAVLDTGICTTHPDLEVAGGRRFYTVMTGPPQSRLREDGQYEDDHGHGTHVAGSIAALDNSIGVVGVAPQVALYAVKVLSADGSGSVSAIAAGIDWAVQNGIHIINMSLGSSTSSQTLKDACDNAYAAGHLVVSSAGNEGEGTDTVGYPAKYDSVIAVAASNINDQRASFSSTGPAVELIAPGEDILSTIPWTEEASLTVDGVSYQANPIENAAVTDASGVTAPLVDGGRATSTNSAWSGKVVLVERGDISFYDKVMNVQNSGGVAAVIYNNEPGNFYGTLGDGSSTIPAISLSQEDGQWLVANKLGTDGTVVNLYDPNTPGYASWGGTSMASPHVAGVAALVWAADPTLSNVQLRGILQSTAEDLGLPWNHQGYGLVRADLAVAAAGGEPPPPPQEYNLTISSTAGGSVTAPGEGTFTYEEGTVVDLVATADSGYQFAGWTGDTGTIADVNAASTTITMNGDYSITANFEEKPPAVYYDLTISSSAGGSVTTPGEGTFTYEEGTVVDLVATAGSGYQFAGWTGDTGTIADVNAASTTITMNGDYTITANFEEAPVGAVVRVEAITYSTSGGRLQDRHLAVTLLLLDDQDNPVAGASVSATLHRDAGGSWNFAGTTGSNGTVTFTLNNHGSGCYHTVVTAVTASGLTWDGETPDNGYCK
ncbi:MAG: S8 family serine peptidase [Dehalococcoidia bacterium]|nr:S8 family serine peptidase [Dehalococcoidia bacterium]